MRTHPFLLTAALIIPACYLTACRDTVKPAAMTEQPVTAAIVTPTPAALATGYELQVAQSVINWKGAHIVGGAHEGTLKPASGDLAADADGKWVGGYFVIDMNTIRSADQKEGQKESGFIQHLKDDDFFAVKKFPKGYFTLTQATPGAGANEFTITGKLTLKNITQDITFPATLEHIGDQLNARASFKINRTKWGINYQSGSIFSNLKNDIISDDIPITLNLVFKKKG